MILEYAHYLGFFLKTKEKEFWVYMRAFLKWQVKPEFYYPKSIYYLRKNLLKQNIGLKPF
ncbi:MAG: hypothetical protein CM15mP58_18610 [Burkholderiaceae bacterium]|nr:MAG: hypothetical protein CM15mP58_18610 [Burkholderiaceae bacterium]